MPPLSPLLDVQALDLESDRLVERLRTLPERAELVRTGQRVSNLDADHTVLHGLRPPARPGNPPAPRGGVKGSHDPPFGQPRSPV